MIDTRSSDIGAEVRRYLAPEPGDPRAKQSICDDCGQPFWQWLGKYKYRCVDCSHKRSVEAIAAMKTKSGPAYEKWLANTQAARERRAAKRRAESAIDH